MNRVSGRLARWVVLMLVLASVIFWLLAGITVHLNPQSPLSELKTARAAWKNHNPNSYVMTVDFASFSYTGTFQVSVWNNSFSSVTTLDGRTMASLPIQDFPAGWRAAFASRLPSAASGYTVDQLFDFVELRLASQTPPPVVAWCGAGSSGSPTEPRYEVTYDREQGYIRSLTYTNCVRYDWGVGLLCPIVSDCSLSLHVRSIQPIV